MPSLPPFSPSDSTTLSGRRRRHLHPTASRRPSRRFLGCSMSQSRARAALDATARTVVTTKAMWHRVQLWQNLSHRRRSWSSPGLLNSAVWRGDKPDTQRGVVVLGSAVGRRASEEKLRAENSMRRLLPSRWPCHSQSFTPCPRRRLHASAEHACGPDDDDDDDDYAVGHVIACTQQKRQRQCSGERATWRPPERGNWPSFRIFRARGGLGSGPPTRTPAPQRRRLRGDLAARLTGLDAIAVLMQRPNPKIKSKNLQPTAARNANRFATMPAFAAATLPQPLRPKDPLGDHALACPRMARRAVLRSLDGHVLAHTTAPNVRSDDRRRLDLIVDRAAPFDGPLGAHCDATLPSPACSTRAGWSRLTGHRAPKASRLPGASRS